MGVPAILPVEAVNFAHDGLLVMEKRNRFPSGSEAVGWNVYCEPATTVAGGEPEIVGAELGAELGPELGPDLDAGGRACPSCKPSKALAMMTTSPREKFRSAIEVSPQ